MSAERNTEVLRAAYAKWGEGVTPAGINQWLGLVSDTIDFRSVGMALPGVPLGQAGQRKEDVATYLTKLGDDWKMNFFNVERFVAQDDCVAAILLCSFTNKATGEVLTTPKVDVWKFNTAGKATSFFEYYDTAALVKAASHEERNARKLREAYALWQTCKDNPQKIGEAVAHWVSLFADTFQFTSAGHEVGALKFNKRRTRKDELSGYFADIASEWQMKDYVVKRMVAKDDWVIAICKCKWRCIRNGMIVKAIKVDSWRFNDAGQVIEFDEQFDTAPVLTVLNS